ncbi:MAG: Cof-type HAD-IIB family hydrolase [Oscillospiraceae bacterium]|nr:Cof-type HAD-IIB family hydrolase [Oscillospiraceae bacterium]
MGKFTGIILVSDFDGTFFSQIPENFEKNIKAVENFKKQGGMFTFATGREYYPLIEILPDAENIVNAPLIIANGARLYDTDNKEYLFSVALNISLFNEFLEIIYKKYPDIGVRFSCESGMVIPVLNEVVKTDLGGLSLMNMKIREISLKELEESGEAVYKCVMVHNPEILDDVRKISVRFQIDKDINRELFFTKSYERGLEAVNSKASKGAAAVRVKEYLKAKYNQEYTLFAIGDYDNDLDMIISADYGAAPENALERVKKAAKIRTVSCNDGAIADLIDIIERKYV